jgi:hypothetical protein
MNKDNEILLPVPDRWEKDIDKNLDSKFSSRFYLGHTIVFQPESLPNNLTFDEARLAVGFYCWVKGLKGFSEDTILERYTITIQQLQKIKENIIDWPQGDWQNIVLKSCLVGNKGGKVTGYKYQTTNEKRKKAAWDRIISELWLECGNSPEKWAEFKLTRLVKKYNEKPQYLSKRRSQLLGYMRLAGIALSEGLDTEDVHSILSGFNPEDFDPPSHQKNQILKDIYILSL